MSVGLGAVLFAVYVAILGNTINHLNGDQCDVHQFDDQQIEICIDSEGNKTIHKVEDK